MSQRARMNSASNAWEADPWDASDAVADEQQNGFEARARLPIVWVSIRSSEDPIFGIEHQQLIGADVEFHANHDGEEMLLMQLAWHGFPDPPEWRLATRSNGESDQQWKSWGYFSELPHSWKMPEAMNAKN